MKICAETDAGHDVSVKKPIGSKHNVFSSVPDLDPVRNRISELRIRGSGSVKKYPDLY
jgi:hypothetical protein